MNEGERVLREGEERRAQERSQLPPSAQVAFDRAEQLRHEYTNAHRTAMAAYSIARAMKNLQEEEPQDSELHKAIADFEPVLKRRWEAAVQEQNRLDKVLQEADAELKELVTTEELAKVPQALMSEAKGLLKERDRKIAELPLPISPATFGAAGGTVFGLEIRLKNAEDAGNSVEAKRLRTELEAAIPQMRAAENAMKEHASEVNRIKASYERRIAELSGRSDT